MAPALAPFEDVYRANAARVYAFCLSQVSNPSDAEDLAADVFASAFAAYERSRPPSDRVQAWLMRIARNATIDHHRHRHRWAALQSILDRDPRREPSTDVESAVVLRDELRHVLGRMGRLRRRDRVLVGLRAAADLSYAEIGAVLGISEHAATMATKRAVERLRRHCVEEE